MNLVKYRLTFFSRSRHPRHFSMSSRQELFKVWKSVLILIFGSHFQIIIIWNVAFLDFVLSGMCPFWNMPFLESALFGMCSFWNVLFLECALFGMCSFWNVLFLECTLFGILPLKCALFRMCPFWNVPYVTVLVTEH